MPTYRVYVLWPDNRIREMKILISANDRAAVLEAQELDGHAVEIWQGTRLVARVIPPQREPKDD
jgi:hypothetical protein